MSDSRALPDQNDSPSGTLTFTESEDDDAADDGDEGPAPSDGGDRQAPAARADGNQPAARNKAGGRAERRDLWKSNQELKSQLEQMTQRQAGQLSELRATFQQQMDEMRRSAMGGQQRGQQQEQGSSSPTETQLTTIQAALQAELAAVRNHNPAQGQYDLTRYHALDRQKRKLENQLDTEEFFRSRGIDPNKRAEPQQQMDAREMATQVHMQNLGRQVKADHPWLLTEGPQGDRMRKAMIKTVEFLEEVEGRPRDSLEVHREAAAMVEAKMGMSRRQPARGQPSRYAPVVEGSRAAGGPRTIEVPAEQVEGSGLPPDKLRRAILRGQARGG